jgi:predicted dehydrogenase
MTRPVGWGVLGATSMIHRLALRAAITDADNARLVATASRSGADLDGGDAVRRYGAYEQVLADPDVEVVYIPLPNGLHEQWTVAAARAGKHVLCEKPLAPDAAAAHRMVAACERAGVLLVEAYMTPFHPRSHLWERTIASGRVGRLHTGWARFTFPHDDPGDFRWLPEQGGGALLDVGIYCLEPLLAAGGWTRGDAPPAMAAQQQVTDGGVDATFTGWLGFPSGFTATFCCSFDAPERQVLEVVGTDGAMTVEPAFTPDVDDCRVAVVDRGGTADVLVSRPGAMYQLMVEQVGRAVRGHHTLRRSARDAVALLELVDGLREVAR